MEKETTEEKLMFSEVLKKLLKDRSISQRQAAVLADVPETVMSDWINNAVPRDLLAVRRLAKALAVSTSYLLYGEKEETIGISIEELLQAEEKPTLSGLYRIEFRKVKVAEHLLKKEK
jgi:transcriptional regulator with XRE-family HTH domain